MTKLILAYWNIRGLANALRMILEHAGVDYEDRVYTQADDLTRKEWSDVKYTLGLDFPNLPYVIDGDVKLTQSNAILMYLGSKTGLAGSTDAERAVVHMLADQLMDLRNAMVNVFYSSSPTDELKAGLIAKAHAHLKAFDAYLGDKAFLTGAALVCVDFVLFELCAQLELYSPGIVSEHANIQRHYAAVGALPKVAAFVASDRGKRDCNNKSASWRGSQ